MRSQSEARSRSSRQAVSEGMISGRLSVMTARPCAGWVSVTLAVRRSPSIGRRAVAGISNSVSSALVGSSPWRRMPAAAPGVVR